MKHHAWLSRTFVLIGLTWCVVVGFWIWFTPVRYAGITGGLGQPDQHTVVDKAFADVSPLGPLPLLIPTLIAIAGARAAWRGARVALGVAALLLAAYAFATGFSIGNAYILPAGLLLLAALFEACFHPRRSPGPDSDA